MKHSNHDTNHSVKTQITDANFGELLQANRRYLLAIALDSMSPQLLKKVPASDLVQKTFQDALVDPRGFQGTSERQLRAWLRTILINNLANTVRDYGAIRRDISKEISDHDTESPVSNVRDPADEVEERELLERIQAALNGLPDDYRQVVTWRSIERRSFPEIGKEMGRSADACRKLWFRAIKKLGEGLGDAG